MAYKRTALGWSAAVSAGLTTLSLADWMLEPIPAPETDPDDDMFDGDEPERDHQAARFDHAHDLRKHA